MPPTYALLACDVFSEELTELAGSRPPWRAIDYLEMGLHDRPDDLREAVQDAIASLEADPEVRAVLLAYGRCGNGLVGICAGRCPLILPQAHDCISILLGGRTAHNAALKENPGTYFYSPGWVRGKRVPGPDREAYLRELYAQRYADDEDMIDELVEADQEAFAHHNCAAYVSIVDRPEAERYCRDCAKHLGWMQKTLPADPSFLRNLLEGQWASERFLRVEPGQTIGADSAGNLIALD
jgi:hypothetical protein